MCNTLPINLQLPANFENNLKELSTMADISTTEKSNVEEDSKWEDFNNCFNQVWDIF